MRQKATTKDELFLVKLLDLASKNGDPHALVDLYLVARQIGQNDRGAAVIARDLAQANFIKKGEGNLVALTPHGLRLAQSLASASSDIRRSS